MNFISKRFLSTLRFPIKYGHNPHQGAKICKNSNSNIKLLNGIQSYINYLDAIHGWKLVSRLSNILQGHYLTTSIKHTIPTSLGISSSNLFMLSGTLKSKCLSTFKLIMSKSWTFFSKLYSLSSYSIFIS